MGTPSVGSIELITEKNPLYWRNMNWQKCWTHKIFCSLFFCSFVEKCWMPKKLTHQALKLVYSILQELPDIFILFCKLVSCVGYIILGQICSHMKVFLYLGAFIWKYKPFHSFETVQCPLLVYLFKSFDQITGLSKESAGVTVITNLQWHILTVASDNVSSIVCFVLFSYHFYHLVV